MASPGSGWKRLRIGIFTSDKSEFVCPRVVRVGPTRAVVFDWGGCHHRAVYLWNFGSGQITRLPDRPLATRNFGAVFCETDHRLYLVGGYGRQTATVDEHEYDDACVADLYALDVSSSLLDEEHEYGSPASKWKKLPPMPTPRAHCEVVVVSDTKHNQKNNHSDNNSRIYVFGGKRYDRILNHVEWYCVHSQTWTSLTNDDATMHISHARCHFSATVVGSKVYLIGGENGKGRPVREVDVWDADTGRFLEESSSYRRIPHPYGPRYHAAVAVQFNPNGSSANASSTRIVIIGGSEGVTATYDPGTDSWYQNTRSTSISTMEGCFTSAFLLTENETVKIVSFGGTHSFAHELDLSELHQSVVHEVLCEGVGLLPEVATALEHELRQERIVFENTLLRLTRDDIIDKPALANFLKHKLTLADRLNLWGFLQDKSQRFIENEITNQHHYHHIAQTTTMATTLHRAVHDLERTLRGTEQPHSSQKGSFQDSQSLALGHWCLVNTLVVGFAGMALVDVSPGSLLSEDPEITNTSVRMHTVYVTTLALSIGLAVVGLIMSIGAQWAVAFRSWATFRRDHDQLLHDKYYDNGGSVLSAYANVAFLATVASVTTQVVALTIYPWTVAVAMTTTTLPQGDLRPTTFAQSGFQAMEDTKIEVHVEDDNDYYNREQLTVTCVLGGSLGLLCLLLLVVVRSATSRAKRI